MSTSTHQAQSFWQRISSWVLAFEEAMDMTEYDILDAKFKRLENRFNELEDKLLPSKKRDQITTITH